MSAGLKTARRPSPPRPRDVDDATKPSASIKKTPAATASARAATRRPPGAAAKAATSRPVSDRATARPVAERAGHVGLATRPARATGIGRARGRAAFAVVFCTIVAFMGLGLVSLKALLAQQSFAVDDLSTRLETLEGQHLELVSEQAQLSAPGRIAEWARRNGMRLPDDIRLLHAPGASTAPAGAGTPGSGG